MSYEKTNWVDRTPTNSGTPVNAANMNKIEEGIEDVAIQTGQHITDNDIHVTAADKIVWNEKADGSVFNSHKAAATLDHPDSSVTTAKIANGAVTNEKLADAVKNRITTLEGHQASTENPHQTSKEQVGLGEVTNDKQATKVEFDAHKNGADLHTTAEEKSAWNSMVRYKLIAGDNIIIDENNIISAVVPVVADIPYLSINGRILYATTFVDVIDDEMFLRDDGTGDFLLTIAPNGTVYAKDLIKT